MRHPGRGITGAEAEKRGIDLAGGMEFLGVTDIPGNDVWLCTSCDNYGIMGPADRTLSDTRLQCRRKAAYRPLWRSGSNLT